MTPRTRGPLGCRRTLATIATSLAGIAVAAFALGGCRPDFVPYNRLTSLRVLGVQSDPPSPASGETATLSALVYAPPGSPAPTYTWSWCPLTGPSGEGYPCALGGQELTDAALAALLSQARVTMNLPAGDPPPPLSLGTGTTAQLSSSIEPALLKALCSGALTGILASDCSNGFPFRIKLKVEIDGEQADHVDVVFTTRWRFDASMADNANPTIDGLFATRDQTPMEITDQASATLPGVTLPRDTPTAIHATVSPAAAETYQGLDDNGQPATLQERLFITWFVETGDVDDSSTSFIADRTPFDDLQRNTWTPGLKKNYASDQSSIFVVIHDSRGGVSWRNGAVNLEPTP